MGIGIGIIVFADGAILTWATGASKAGWNAHWVGYVLIVLGTLGLLLAVGRRGYAAFARSRPLSPGGLGQP
jgi:hypothetical protein